MLLELGMVVLDLSSVITSIVGTLIDLYHFLNRTPVKERAKDKFLSH